MNCKGDSTEICGGANRLDVYQYGATGSSPTISTTAPAASSPTTSTTAPAASSPTTSTTAPAASTPATSTLATSTPVPTLGNKQTVGAYTFQGCYTEATNTRALSGASFYDYAAMTIEECAADCAGWQYFGVEYGGECEL
jgi:hypothetical protein